jgi:hypothetical protein
MSLLRFRNALGAKRPSAQSPDEEESGVFAPNSFNKWFPAMNLPRGGTCNRLARDVAQTEHVPHSRFSPEPIDVTVRPAGGALPHGILQIATHSGFRMNAPCLKG